MYQTNQFKITNPNSMNRLPLWRGLFLIPLLLVCFALAPSVRAVVPAPDGGYPGANTAEGTQALFSRTTGVWNTALGFQALYHLTTGNQNTATGFRALFSLTTGSQNTADGIQALFSNIDGFGNVAVGFQTLIDLLHSDYNTAVGYQAASNNTAFYNTAVGSIALLDNVNGSYNTAVGRRALENSIGSDNAALGYNSGANSTGNGSVFVGANAGLNETSASDVVCIDENGDGTAFATGNRTFIGHIRGVTVGNGDGIAVIIDSDGQLGTTNSSRRFKDDIKPIDKTSEAILSLKPVTFRYKNEDNNGKTPQYGLIAEDVAEINPDLVVLGDDGQPLTVRYDAVNTMLLNEFIKEHRKVADLQATVAKQEKGMEVMAASLKEQAAQIQKVSAQLAVQRSTPQVVANH
jgi:hypothetical protein